jgi:hypothetical protein
MLERQLITIRPQLWDAINSRAAAQALSAEDWLVRQLEAGTPPVQEPDAAADALVFDLALRHFRDLGLGHAERSRLAEAMFRTLDAGGSSEVPTVGRQRRHYRFHRRTGVLQIRVGEGAIELPLAQAMRLATQLDARAGVELADELAA